MLTMLNLASGMTGIRFAMEGKWQEAVIAIAVAALFDMLDGRIARMLNAQSKFGEELDSLSDMINEDSPLFGETSQSLHDKNAEIIVSMTGLDESLSSMIYTRFSYVADEIHFGRSFEGILRRMPDNTLEVHYDKIHDLRD